MRRSLIAACGLVIVGAYLVVGAKEKANGAVAVRARGNQDLGAMSVSDFAHKLSADISRTV